MEETSSDVVVVGAGNAALCAALSARERGASVLVLEAAPFDARGGNSRFTAGAMRVPYDGLADILKLIPDLGAAERANTEFAGYSRDAFFDDMARLTQYRAQPELVEILVNRSFDALMWLRGHGIRFLPAYGAQAFNVNNKYRFGDGLTIEAVGGGPGLVDTLTSAVRRGGGRVLYGARATALVADAGGVRGVRLRHDGREFAVAARAVVLACGGFESNAEWRARYIGPGWDLAKVRGTCFNMGDGIRMALDVGARPHGHWSGCHAVGWDMNAPEFGDLAVGEKFQKHSYPLGIILNARGERFVDEGADLRNFTYAKYGRAVLEQPGQFAWQVFDARVATLLNDDYRIRQVTKVTADTLEGLAAKLEGVDGAGFLRTVAAFNAAVRDDVPFNPAVKDGRGTQGLALPKSNWANRIETPPFEAYGITCGITFTFGGVKIDTEGRVLDTADDPIPGLYAAGEMVGGLFYHNYPSGSGLTSGTVFGRLAGASAGGFARA
ncbi:FAD-dependent tricarballylate dehydrogenase TcuA [Falsiroseomonas sp. HW251]|uniref:FAD-dependent tricarballylate dehydrogenase TcuA n=1 Tax=Falsiroseomonas sp. HW251 TaxID=3390998 RepID=UPI003D322383